jgi:aryl-alcohol dehydrogenase-like predicted oxidoreductase
MIAHRPLGRTGLNVSACTLGTSALASPGLDRREAGAMIARALEHGVNAAELDSGHGRAADLLGEVIAREGARNRVHIFARVTSRVRFDLPSPHIPAHQAYPGRHIRAETEALLRTLGVEQLGLQQIHAWCPEWLREGDWLETLHRLREEGKIAGLGISLWDHDVDAALEAAAGGLIDTVQLMYNVFDPAGAATLLPLCQRHGLGVIARAPLYFGALAWAERPAFPSHDWRDAYFFDAHRQETYARVQRLAREAGHGSTVRETALRFALSHPAVATVALGMRTPAQLETNLAALEQGPLSAEQLQPLAAHAWLC